MPISWSRFSKPARTAERRSSLSRSCGVVCAVVIFVSASSWAATAHSIRVGALEIVHPWIAVPSPGVDRTCAYFKIINHGTEADKLLWAATPIARNAVLMRSGQAGESGTVSDGLLIPPGATIAVRPPAWCLRLTGLQVSLEAEFGVYDGSLHFAKAGTIAIEFMCHDAKH